MDGFPSASSWYFDGRGRLKPFVRDHVAEAAMERLFRSFPPPERWQPPPQSERHAAGSGEAVKQRGGRVTLVDTFPMTLRKWNSSEEVLQALSGVGCLVSPPAHAVLSCMDLPSRDLDTSFKVWQGNQPMSCPAFHWEVGKGVGVTTWVIAAAEICLARPETLLNVRCLVDTLPIQAGNESAWLMVSAIAGQLRIDTCCYHRDYVLEEDVLFVTAG